MAAISHRHQIVYTPVPKNACSSLKMLLWDLETDGRPLPELPGNFEGVHRIWPSRPDGGVVGNHHAGYLSFCVVRDPVRRFVSAYRNRVVHHEDAASEAALLDLLRMDQVPSLEDFVDRLPVYLASHTVWHHFLPQARFLHRTLPLHDVVTGLDGLDGLVERLSDHVGRPLTLPHVQTGGPSDVHVSDDVARRIASYYVEDYALLAPYGFEPPGPLPDGGREWARQRFTFGLRTQRLRRKASGLAHKISTLRS